MRAKGCVGSVGCRAGEAPIVFVTWVPDASPFQEAPGLLVDIEVVASAGFVVGPLVWGYVNQPRSAYRSRRQRKARYTTADFRLHFKIMLGEAGGLIAVDYGRRRALGW